MMQLLPYLPGLVALLLVVADKVSKKTKTKVDDKIVKAVKDHAPDVVKAIEALLKKEAEKPAPAPREKVRDHR